MASITIDCLAGVEAAVHELKIERDTWHAVALQYKTAFEAQTSRLNELQDICFATQAELENERAQGRRLHVDGAEHYQQVGPSFGTATVLSPRKADTDSQHRSSDDDSNPLFTRVHDSVAQRNYGTALVEVERLLRGPLSSKARAEGLLLKSRILRASGPDELYDALAACSEALELCDRLSELESFLPRLQYQRGILCYELRMMNQAREALDADSDDDLLSAKVIEHRRSCDDDLDRPRTTKRRSGFEESRGITAGLLAHLEKGPDVGLPPDAAPNVSRYTYDHIEQASAYEHSVTAIRCRTSEANVITASLGRLEERWGLGQIVVRGAFRSPIH